MFTPPLVMVMVMELNQSRTELLSRIQSLKEDLHNWRLNQFQIATGKDNQDVAKVPQNNTAQEHAIPKPGPAPIKSGSSIGMGIAETSFI
ncbi:hypothetical protein K1719_004583 [Acacia pycnantha]|nr:hypothetical protein K1719_004583 [Acacia pycnantha]